MAPRPIRVKIKWGRRREGRRARSLRFSAGSGQGRGQLCSAERSAGAERSYLKELAEQEACSREAGTDPGVRGGEQFFGLQGVLKSGDQPVRASRRLLRAGDGPPLWPSATLGRRGKALGVDQSSPDAGAQGMRAWGLVPAETAVGRRHGRGAPSGGPPFS